MVKIKLSKKISVIVFMEVIGLVIVIVLLSKTIFLSGFEEVEIMNIKQSADRLEDDLHYEIDAIDSINLDYSSWDDTYEFLMYGDDNYIDSNFSNVTVSENFNINFCRIVGLDGKVKFDAGYDASSGRRTSMDSDVKNMFESRGVMEKVLENGVPQKGILKAGDDFIMISIRPVLRSSGKGPLSGVIAMGRIVDEQEITRFSRLTYLDLKMHTYEQFGRIEGVEKLSGSFVKKGEDVIKAYVMIDSIYGADKMVIEVSQSAMIRSLGYRLLKKYVYIVVIMAFVLAYISSRIFEKEVSLRIKKLRNFMKNFGESNGREKRVDISGSDEIASMGASINRMLDSLDESHEKAFQEERCYRMLFEHMSEGFAYAKAVYEDEIQAGISDIEVIDANSRFWNMLGINKNDIECKRLSQLERAPDSLVGKIIEFAKEYENSSASEKTHQTQIQIDEVWYSLIIYSTKPGCFGMIFWDITRMKEREISFMEMARRDHLTKLPNRNYMNEYIKELSQNALKTGGMFAVMFLDVDDFKFINDNYGHSHGDKVLKKIAAIINESIRGQDFAARTGGDEFVIILSNIGNKNAPLSFASRLQSRIEKEISKDENSKIGLSIGISIFPHDGEEISQLIEYADMAMYNAKRSGKSKTRLYEGNVEKNT